MKNKILIGIAVFLILLIIVVRYQFNQKFELFKTSISQYETAQLDIFRKEKEKRVASISNSDTKLLNYFTNQFDEGKAIIEQDTSFSFLYLSDKVHYKTASINYINCLNSKCIIDIQNESSQKLITAKVNELENKYGETFSIWFPRLKEEKLLKKLNQSGDCSYFFPDLSLISFDENIWNDFEKFLIAYNTETKAAEIQNKQVEFEYSSIVATTKNQLRSNVLNYFDEKISDRKSQIISSQSESKSYNSSTLGLITYSLKRTIFDKQIFQNIADDAFEEQWKYNSLYTGATPYSNCFGSNNNCDYFGCSRITVLTGSTDALVTVKDRSGDIVRHAYINSGHSFSFNLPDGTYQVFFYSGSGWNPNKNMNSTSCSSLRGGFVSNEEVSKVSYHDLYNKEWTIELILQENGNLQTQPSSKNEAF
jgi:hypothetical protein